MLPLKINQSINKSINQSLNPASKQSSNQSSKQASNQSVRYVPPSTPFILFTDFMNFTTVRVWKWVCCNHNPVLFIIHDLSPGL
jgi:hypothetical protein